MLIFHNDYNEMCHSSVLEKMESCIGMQIPGYGRDAFCDAAANQIRDLCGDNTLAVHFLVGGTQTNLTVIDAALRAHQGVISAASGHIHVHETGAVEATGHKVLALPSEDGKLTAEQVRIAMESHLSDSDAEHTVQPKLVYISNSTELGTIYYKQELEDLYNTCKQFGLYLFMDGARLGYALTAPDSDLTLQDVARLTDVFYIGGTKCGAMFGEAVVISNPEIAADFRYLIKQHGGMLAKGWLLGLQFSALMENNLYFLICKKANDLAQDVRCAIIDAGFQFLVPTTTNQIFPILSDKALKILGEHVTFSEQGRVDKNHRAVRFCTSWASKPEDVNRLCQLIRSIKE